MKLMKKWRVALIIGLAAIAIPIAASVSPTAPPFVTEAKATPYAQPAAANEAAPPNHASKHVKVAAAHRVMPPQDYYDRRREYWEDRMERRADYLEEEDGNDNDDADSEDAKDSKDSAASDDDEGSMDEEEELIERRREYWRDRLDRDWD